MNSILLLVFLVSPMASHISLRRYAADEAREAAQSIVDEIEKAIATGDNALYLGLHDPSFTMIYCGQTVTYSDLEQLGAGGDPLKQEVEFELTSAVLTGDVLTFVIIEKAANGDEKLTYTAKKVEGTYKIVGQTIEDGCPLRPGPPSLSAGSSSSSSEEDNI